MSRWPELLDELDLYDLKRLMAYSRIEPWGDERADLREAVMASVVVASNGGEVGIAELANYVDDGKPPVAQTPNQVAAAMKNVVFPQ